MKRAPRPPSVPDLRRIQREMKSVLTALRAARRRIQDSTARDRVEEAITQVNARVGRIDRAIQKVADLRTKQNRYRHRLELTAVQINKVLGRTYRGNARWVRKWKRL